MNELTAFEINCFIFGFVGGLCGMSIALFGLRQFFIKHYMRFYRTVDYRKLTHKVDCMNSDLSMVKRQLHNAQRDIYDLYPHDEETTQCK